MRWVVSIFSVWPAYSMCKMYIWRVARIFYDKRVYYTYYTWALIRARRKSFLSEHRGKMVYQSITEISFELFLVFRETNYVIQLRKQVYGSATISQKFVQFCFHIFSYLWLWFFQRKKEGLNLSELKEYYATTVCKFHFFK